LFSQQQQYFYATLPKQDGKQQQPHSPPPTPFNAHAASRHCRNIEGYVSFSDIEGLGAPEDLDADDEEGRKPPQESKRMGLGSLFRVWG
jgi:hypothetical protein